MGYDPDDASTDPASPTGVGNQAAAAVLAFRATDGSNQANGYADTIGYVPVNTPDQVNDPFRWQPLRHPNASGALVVQKYLTPHWGYITPFAMTSPNQFLLPGPTQRTLLQLDEEVTDPAGQRHPHRPDQDQGRVLGRRPRQRDPARPLAAVRRRGLPGQGATTSTRRQADLRPGQRRLDASIAAWNAKLRWDYVRPITAVRTRMKGKLVLAWAGPWDAPSGRDLASVPGGDLPDPAVPRVRVRPLHLQRRRVKVLQQFTGSDLFGPG